MKRYQGIRLNGQRTIYIIDVCDRWIMRPIMRLPVIDTKNPFNWGFIGPGLKGNAVRNAALAILSDCLGEARAEDLYFRFAEEVLSRQPWNFFDLPEEEIHAWSAGIKQAA